MQVEQHAPANLRPNQRSEEHTSELQYRCISYAVFCLKKKKMIHVAPRQTQSMHQHPGETKLYVVERFGHSFIGAAPDRAQQYRWQKGDLIGVDPFLSH